MSSVRYEKCMENERKVYKKDKVNKVFGIGEIGSAVKSSRAGRSLRLFLSLLLLLLLFITWDFVFYASSVTLKQSRSYLSLKGIDMIVILLLFTITLIMIITWCLVLVSVYKVPR